LDAIAKKLEELDERLEDISDDLRQMKDESKLDDISEALGQMKDENKEILQKVENIEDAVAEKADYIVDRAGSVNAEIEDVEQRLTGMIDVVEKTQQDVELESTEMLKTMLDEFRTEV
jgi:predicted  nucleic acid-binding Zn-ribbon protein